MLKSIRFIKPSTPYNTGEIAGFDEKTADRLVNRSKVATYIVEKVVGKDEFSEIDDEKPVERKKRERKSSKSFVNTQEESLNVDID